jgi:predicted dehydrogenase
VGRYRAGIVGCGWVSTAHIVGYRATDRVEVVAAADISEERLKTFGEEWSVRSLYSDYRKMLDGEKLDLVSICTPASTHLEIVKEAVAGRPRVIVCEKPMALSLAEADAILAACQRAGVHVVVCHQRRFEARYVKAVELIRSGAIGKVAFLRTWGGDLFEGSDHVIDLMKFFVEDAAVSRVVGQVEFADPPAQLYGHLSEQAAMGYIIFANGAGGLLLASALAPRELLYGFSILGADGLMEISPMPHPYFYPAPSWVRVKGKGDSEWKHVEAPEALAGTPSERLLGRGAISYFWLDCWQRLMESALRTAETGEDGPCSGVRARATLEVIIAMHASARLRKVMEFPVEAMDSPVVPEAQEPDSIWKRP